MSLQGPRTTPSTLSSLRHTLPATRLTKSHGPISRQLCTHNRMLSLLHSLRPACISKPNTPGFCHQSPFLKSLITKLHYLIKQQYPAIQTLLKFANNNPLLTSRLKRIQIQHSDIQKLLTQTSHATKKLRSRRSWLDELIDVEVSMRKKIKQCNRTSRPDALGWLLAAKRYWPLIAESYDAIEKLLDRLELLLAGTELADNGRREKFGARTVRFSKEINGRWIQEEGNGACKEFTLRLMNDKKRSARRHKAMRKARGGDVVGKSKTDEDIWLEVARECEDLRAD